MLKIAWFLKGSRPLTKIDYSYARNRHFVSENGVQRVPAYALPNNFIVGTIGADDAFCAGALFGIYQGRTNKEILELASAAFRSHYKMVSKFYSTHKNEYLCKFTCKYSVSSYKSINVCLFLHFWVGWGGCFGEQNRGLLALLSSLIKLEIQPSPFACAWTYRGSVYTLSINLVV